jgi:acyl-coenzyme A thioesterase PaaI-like protein
VDASQVLCLQFEPVDGEEVQARLKIEEKFRGWPGLAHGGIIGALLTEALVRAAENAFQGRAALSSFEIDFLQPVLLERELTVKGRALREAGGRLRAEAEVYYAGDLAVLAKSSGILEFIS